MQFRQPPKLILNEPSGTRREVVIQKTPFTIGRDAESDLHLRDNRISRQHAIISAENGRYVIRDCDSKHGTYVNDVRVEQAELHNNDRIEFGVAHSYSLVFTTEETSLGDLLRRVEQPLVEAPSRELRCLNLLRYTDTGELELADADDLGPDLLQHFQQIVHDISSGRSKG